MKLNLRRNVAIVLWTSVIALSCFFNYKNYIDHYWDMGYQAADGFFSQIVITRRWNASRGGVYAPVTPETQPNPYLKTPDRDIYSTDGTALTMINPAYMTRQLSELASKENDVQFRITSLDPVRPENSPNSREQFYLKRFTEDPTPAGEIIDKKDGKAFFYMAPLITEEACLQCHEEHGYQVGDVRGGISVEVPYKLGSHFGVVAGSHLLILGVGLAGILIFFSKLNVQVTRVEHYADHDPLTQLLNRRSFVARFDAEVRRARRSGAELCILMIDADDFKRINDTEGHSVGDQCLQALARILSSVAGRPGDAIGRWGGEEFVVLLPEIPRQAAALVAERIRSQVEELEINNPDRPTVRFTVSIGIASLNEDDTSHSMMINRSDAALYEAKRNGKNRIVLG